MLLFEHLCLYTLLLEAIGHWSNSDNINGLHPADWTAVCKLQRLVQLLDKYVVFDVVI